MTMNPGYTAARKAAQRQRRAAAQQAARIFAMTGGDPAKVRQFHAEVDQARHNRSAYRQGRIVSLAEAFPQ
jgi:hypothetical protein